MQAIIFAAMKALITFIAIAAVSVGGAGFYYVSSNSAKAEADVQLPKRNVQLPKRSATRKPLAMKAQNPTVVLRQIAPTKRRLKTKILLD